MPELRRGSFGRRAVLRLLRRPARTGAAEGQRRQIAALFCDLVESTPLSQRMDIEEYGQLCFAVQQLATETVEGFGGTVGHYAEATLGLHMEQGIHPTSLQEVAERADVALGTVYRHFPNVDELVEGCGALATQLMQLPEPADVPARFDGASTRPERLKRLVDEVAAIYRDWALAFRRIREARDHFERVARDHRAMEALIDAFVDEALRPLRPRRDQRAAVRAVMDDRFWQVLLDRGLDPAAAERELLKLVTTAVARTRR